MTNQDAIEDLNLIHSSIDNLIQIINSNEDIEAKHILSFLELIENRYSPLHEHLNKQLHSVEVLS